MRGTDYVSNFLIRENEVYTYYPIITDINIRFLFVRYSRYTYHSQWQKEMKKNAK
jgi:hypothetical protein